MKEQTDGEVLAEVQRHTIGNRKEIEASKFAGCVLCCARFGTVEIVSWRDEWSLPAKHNRGRRWTALCPRCGKSGVVGSSTGLLNDQAYEPVVSLIIERAAKRAT